MSNTVNLDAGFVGTAPSRDASNSEFVSSNLPAVKDFLENMSKSLQRARENLVAAQSRMKASKDSKRRDVNYSVDDRSSR